MVTKPKIHNREISLNAILNALKNKPLGFGDLVKSTGFSEAGLNKNRIILLERKLIEPIIQNGKKVYKITKKGITLSATYPYLARLIDEIHSRDGRNFSDYSTMMGSILSSKLPWGIESHLICDKDVEKLQLLSSKDVSEIEKLVYEKISNNIKKNKLNKQQVGKMVLGFDIEYDALFESIIQQSLLYLKHISKEEHIFLNKYENDPESLTEKEFKKMSDLRTKTRKKIKKLNL